MKHFYLLILRWLGILTFICSTSLFAQIQSDTIVRHKIWVKLDSPIPTELYRSSHQDGNVRTGRTSLDQLNQGCGVIRMKRVFSPTQKFEKAHEHYGLHLWYEVEFPDTLATSEQELAALFCKDAWVATAETIPVRTRYAATSLDRKTLTQINDPRYDEQWHFSNTGQSGGTPGADIHLTDAWELNSGNSSVTVAVIDGGIDVKHEDLQGALWVNQRELEGTDKVDDDGNGYVDDIYGYGFGDKRGKFNADRHGTHVAGIIGAVNNNGIGVAGVAGGDGETPGVRLMSCAVFGSYGQGSFPEAFVYAADNGAVIAQNSWEGGGKSRALEDAINYFVARAGFDNSDENFDKHIQTGPMAGGLVIFAAGNSNAEREEIAYPASLESVLAVASLDHDDKKSDFSNYGSWIDVAAPGSEILSTFPGNSYGYLSGTSMACPHVSGVAALAISQFQHQGLTSQSIRQLLLANADDIYGVNDSYVGKLGQGRINAYRVLSSVTSSSPAAVTDLQASDATFHSVVVSWTVPETDNASGTYYRLKGSTKVINDSNFGSAPIDTTIYPGVNGNTYSVVINGLEPTTSYYFALKAVSLMEKVSPLSNTISVKTLEPPRIQLQPDRLTARLDAGTWETGMLTVDNSLGKSDLSFNISVKDNSVDWFQLQSNSGVVAAGKSQLVQVKWNARRLNAGEYHTQLQVTSNDPENPTQEVPVDLTVIGTPALSSSASRLDFSKVYLSFSKKAYLTIRNTGTDTLKLKKFEADATLFQISTSSVDIPPAERHQLVIEFTPLVDRVYESELVIHTNDPDHELYTIPLEGYGVIPPLLLFNPEEYVTEVEQEESIQKKVLLQNTSFEDTIQWKVNGPLPDWMILAVDSGSLEPRAVSELPVLLSAATIEVGHYTTEVSVQLSDGTLVHLPVTMEVLPPNDPPIWHDSLLEFTAYINQTEVVFNLTDSITDPDGDVLRFTFQPQGFPTAIVEIAEGVLKLIPHTVGSFNGTITATDERNNQSEVKVRVKVLPPNQAPESVRASVNMVLRFSDDSFVINLDTLFRDPDNDALVYSFARPSFTDGDLVILEDSVVNLNIQGQQLTGQTSALGDGKVIVYAYDPAGEYTTTILAFSVLPPNQAPLVQQSIDNQQLIEQEELIVDLLTLFTDPDKDSLTYEVITDNSSIADVLIESAKLHITALSVGETTVTVSAQDESGDQVSFDFILTVARVTAIAPTLTEQKLQLYPNPASDQVTVAQPDVQRLEVYDTWGRKLAEHSATAVGEINFSVGFLPQGVYQVLVFTRQGEIHRTSLIRE